MRNKEHRGAAFGGAPNGGAASWPPSGTVFFVSCIASPLKTNKKEVIFADRLGPIWLGPIYIG